VADVKGFRGLRYNTGKAGDLNLLVCPPYDIITPEQREEYIRKSPFNAVRLELPSGGDGRYREAGDLLKKWMDDGVLEQDAEEGIYICEMEFSADCERKSLKGFVGLVKLSDYSEGIVFPHEETLSKDKTDRYCLMSETHCNFSSVYSLYADEDGVLRGLLDECTVDSPPDMSVTDGDNTTHSMWRVTDENILKRLADAFKNQKLYIADGHHRYETALKYCEERGGGGYVMMMFVDMANDGLRVYPTHRILRNLDGFDIDKVLDDCGAYFSVEKASDEDEMGAALRKRYDEGRRAFALYSGGGECHIMTLTDVHAVKGILPSMSDAYCGLDVSVLHSLVLERVFGIDKENMANQKNLSYTRVLRKALEAVDFHGADCAFILNPTKVAEIRDVALAGEKMPQKSTYFHPKLITGLVMNKIK
jgi:uncharacterized protein (DUF1015 family)